MQYLANRLDERLDVTKKFPWAKTVVCLGLAYFQEAPPAANLPAAPGKIARYAWGRDYHKVIDKKLRTIETRLRDSLGEQSDALDVRSYSDTGPILEREFAARAGLGWIGKHTLLIHPQKGSWFLLGEMILNLELEPDSPIADHCGTCTRCIDACPTNAITPYSVNATRCISYLTLEHREQIAPEFHGPIREAGFVVGCDICQDVCPFNRRPLETSEPDFAVQAPAPAADLRHDPQVAGSGLGRSDAQPRISPHQISHVETQRRNSRAEAREPAASASASQAQRNQGTDD